MGNDAIQTSTNDRGTGPRPAPSRRRWFRFSLRTLLLVITVIALWLGFKVHAARQQQRAVAALRAGGWDVQVLYDCQVDDSGQLLVSDDSGRAIDGFSEATWLDNLLGWDLLHDVVHVEVIPEYPRDSSGSPINRHEFCDIHLNDLLALKRLKYLSLHDSSVTDAELQQLSGLNELRFLDVESSKITDQGLMALSALEKLEALDLTGTKISDAGIEHLKAIPHLKQMGLERTRVTRRGFLGLQQAHPALELIQHGGSSMDFGPSDAEVAP